MEDALVDRFVKSGPGDSCYCAPMTLLPLMRIGSTEGAMVKVVKRSAAIGAAAALAGVLSACSGGEVDESASETKPIPEASSVKIDIPKDATAPKPCNLLPPEAATSMGLQPEGQVDDGPKISDDPSDACTWETPDGDNSVSLGPMKDRTIQEYYDNKSNFVDYKEMTIAGHPAVRANEGDPKQDGWCSMFLATDDNQLLHSFASDSSMTDPCGMAQKALEASVPTLPVAG